MQSFYSVHKPMFKYTLYSHVFYKVVNLVPFLIVSLLRVPPSNPVIILSHVNNEPAYL